MDDQRLGAALRTVRVRRGLTQAQLAQRGGVSASLVSLVERGHYDTLSLRSLRAIAAALDIRLDVTARLRTGDIDRLLNAAHARLHEELARLFLALPEWLSAAEVSFAIYGERGVIDVLAFHAPSGSLLVIELKTELVSFEDLLTTMDVRTDSPARSPPNEAGRREASAVGSLSPTRHPTDAVSVSTERSSSRRFPLTAGPFVPGFASRSEPSVRSRRGVSRMRVALRACRHSSGE